MSDLKPCRHENVTSTTAKGPHCADCGTLLVSVFSGVERAQPAQAGQLHQALTDPENQPNQYGVEFLMHGPKFAFKVGAQQFTLDYEPTEPGEFEFMRDMLIHAFTAFTPDVKTAQAGQVLTDAQANEIAKASFEKLCGRPHPWEGAQPWVIDAIKRAANGIVGEKGGQHG